MILKYLVKPAVRWVQLKYRPWLRYARYRLQDVCSPSRNQLVLNCVGDSHTEVFDDIQEKKLIPGVFIRSTIVFGATVLGLANPNSKTNAVPIFNREIRSLKKEQVLCIMLGEIDCGFLLFLRSQRKGTSVISEMEESLRRYEEFLEPLKKLGLAKILVCSVPPPTIRDHSHLGEVANFRREVRASMEERTELTRNYNVNLKSIVERHRFVFVDMEDLLIDKKTGLVSMDLLNPDPCDHHLDLDKVAPMYSGQLINVLELD